MEGKFSPETGYVVDEADILSRERFNLGDNVIADTEMRIIGEAQNSPDTLMFRGTSCLRPEVPTFWEAALKLSEEAKKTVFWACGIGGTVPKEMPPDFYRLLPKVDFWGVRGEMSAMFLRSLGVPRSRVFTTHCPTLLRGVIQGFKYKMKVPTDIKTVVVSTWNGPMPDWLEMIADMYRRNGCRVIIHLQDHLSAWKAVHQGERPEHLKPLFDKYEVAMSRTPVELDELVKSADLVLGVKLHCALPALAWGTPTYTFTDDWRIKEILMPQDLPFISPYQLDKFKGYSEFHFEDVPSYVYGCWDDNEAFLQAAGINYTKNPGSF